jgi:3'5'-cyclic nucleotide phosphodiesterase
VVSRRTPSLNLRAFSGNFSQCPGGAPAFLSSVVHYSNCLCIGVSIFLFQSAIIHDCDHQGVANTQLVQENEELAKRYGGRSVAEQNSIDLAWNLLMQDKYKELRDAVCGTQEEFARFRALVVNGTMATDIMDKVGAKRDRAMFFTLYIPLSCTQT